MDKALLYKYYRAETTPEEAEEILSWIMSSDENKSDFLRERQLWNLSLLYGRNTDIEEKPIRRFQIKPHVWKALSVASMLAVVVLGYQLYHADSTDTQQTIYVPSGQRANILLADGTSVWVNSNSTFSYPSCFNKTMREVSIDGEAYFDVVENRKQPFLIKTKKSKIKVLGTKFNVLDYGSSDLFETSVTNGSVQVCEFLSGESIILQSNEKVTLKNGKFQKQNRISDTGFSWLDGTLVFEDEPIENVMRLLGVYYNKKIRLESAETSDYKCTAKFSYNAGLDYILKIIQKDLFYTIEKENTTNTIILKITG